MRGFWIVLAMVGFVLVGEESKGGPVESESVRQALREGGFNWYDSSGDTYRRLRMMPWPEFDPEFEAPDVSWLGWIFSVLGRAIVFGLFVGALVALVVYLMRHFQWAPEFFKEVGRGQGPGRRVLRAGPLPAELRVDVADPWGAAGEARRAGDLKRAVVFMFAHLLLELERHGLVRLAAGRTGRQLVRSVSDSEIRRRVEPTLRLFEQAYYGHREPDVERFEAAWKEAVALGPVLAARGGS